MEFLTLSDARAKTTYKIAEVLLQMVAVQSELLQRLSWTCTDKDQFVYDQIVTYDVPSVDIIVGLQHAVNKASGIMRTEIRIAQAIADLARDVERTSLGSIIHEVPFGITNLLGPSRREMVSRPVVGSDMDTLISRLGKFWNPDKCVFLMHWELVVYLHSLKVVVYDANKYTYQGAPVIMAGDLTFQGKIACVSLDPAHGLFGIVKGQIVNFPYHDHNEAQRPDFGPVMGWQFEVGIKEKGEPLWPATDKDADENGMHEIMRVSWIGTFGLKNQNAGATIEGLTVPDGFVPPKFPSETPAQS